MAPEEDPTHTEEFEDYLDQLHDATPQPSDDSRWDPFIPAEMGGTYQVPLTTRLHFFAWLWFERIAHNTNLFWLASAPWPIARGEWRRTLHNRPAYKAAKARHRRRHSRRNHYDILSILLAPITFALFLSFIWLVYIRPLP